MAVGYLQTEWMDLGEGGGPAQTCFARQFCAVNATSPQYINDPKRRVNGMDVQGSGFLV